MKSIIDGDQDGICYICGAHGHTEVHHMLHGSRRKAADRYGLTVNLCRRCHMNLHDKGLHDRELEAIAQTQFEKHHGHDEWMEAFGKNYKEDV